MKLNRKWLLAIALVVSLTMAIGGTLAYLTDRDTVENTFTMGNVDIKVEEEFEHNSPLYPGVEVDKKAGITNTHATEPAYVWMTVSVPSDLAQYIELGWDGASPEDCEYIIHEGYVSYVVKHNGILNHGASTPKYLQTVTLSEKVDFQEGSYVVVEGGEIKYTFNDLSDVKIIVDGFAIQTEGFDDVDEAYDAYTTQWNGLNGGESFETIEVADMEELMANLNGGVLKTPVSDDEFVLTSEEAITFDGNNTTVVMNANVPEEHNYGYFGFVPTAGKDVTVSNLKVTGKGFVELGQYGQGGGKYVANNLVIDNLAASLKSPDGTNVVGVAFSHYGNAVLNNCTMTGTTAMQEGVTPYDAGFVHDTTTAINGGTYGKIYMWNRATVTITNATVDQIDANQYVRTNGNYLLTIGNGTHVGTLNLICDATTRQPNVVIESGATVDKIVFGGNEYTLTEWTEFAQTNWAN